MRRNERESGMTLVEIMVVSVVGVSLDSPLQIYAPVRLEHICLETLNEGVLGLLDRSLDPLGVRGAAKAPAGSAEDRNDE